MTHTYRRVHTANAAVTPHTPYADSLTDIQTYFVGSVMHEVYEYMVRLHKRLSQQEPYVNLPFFESWDWGSPRPDGGPGKYQGRVWMKSGHVPELGSVINIHAKFDTNIDIKATTEDKHLITTSYPFKTTPSEIALEIGERWERELTGNVEWANDER